MLEAVFWDVQHGSAAFISTPAKKNIAVDLGTGSYKNSERTFSPLLHLKNRRNINSLDAVIITHPHRDHLGDIDNFYKLTPFCIDRPGHLTHQEIISGNPQVNDQILEKYFEIDMKYNHPITDNINPLKRDNNGGADIQVFYPRNCATSNLNNHSIVTVISYAGSKLLIPGDNEESSWNELFKLEDFLSSIKNTDILVASHHGRKAGFSSALFEHIGRMPYLTIISDGPEGETSATKLYSDKTKGFTVHKRSGGMEERKCLTTRNDGVIVVKFRAESGKRFIDVTID